MQRFIRSCRLLSCCKLTLAVVFEDLTMLRGVLTAGSLSE